jgi:signal transduction protein with GAF and PtsI domain
MKEDPMAVDDKIDPGLFKVVTRSIADTRDLETMSTQLTQLLVGALGIKGCSIFVLNPDTEELEVLSSFGLSANYLNKGPVSVNEGIDHRLNPVPVLIADVEGAQDLQYPEEARKEGIGAMVSLPMQLYGRLIGVLRLYHFEHWEISESDFDCLATLAEVVGLAVMYSRLLAAYQSVKEIVDQVHPIWVE